jgi:hypothetical protein
LCSVVAADKLVYLTHSDAKVGTNTGSDAASAKTIVFQLSACYAMTKRISFCVISGEVKNKATTAKDIQYAIGL